MTNFKVGDKVQLYPGDTHKKVAKILHIGDHGWEFEIITGTSTAANLQVGQIYFVSYSNELSMTKL